MSHLLTSQNTRPEAELQLDQMSVVVFLADIARKDPVPGNYEQVHQGQSLLPLFCSSVIQLYPDARFVLLTTPGTQLPPLPVPVSVYSRPVSAGPLLYHRLSAYIAFLDGAADDRPCLFLESDMLLLRRLSLPKAPDWDLALTYKIDGALINSGMILVRADRRPRAIAFLREAQRLYEERHWNSPNWGSDQEALRDAAALREPPSAQRVQTTTTADVLLISRDKFTRFAEPTSDALLRRPPTYILHFSGWCKEMMRPYYWLHFGRGAILGWGLSRIIALPIVGTLLSRLLQSHIFGPEAWRLLNLHRRVRWRLRRMWQGSQASNT